MSNRSGRSWYRLSSIVRPTPYSSRDPSPPPPPSPPPQPLSPPSPRSPPKQIKEANTSPLPFSLPTKHDPPKTGQKHETTTHRKNILTPPHSSRDPSPPRHVISPPPSPTPRSPPKETKETNSSPVALSRSAKHDSPKPGHGPSEKTDLVNTQDVITNSPSEKTNLVQGPNNDQQKYFNISSNEFNDTIVNTEGFITIISGENKGAVMKIIQSSSSDDEGNESKSKSKSKKHSNNGENLPMNGFVNSNVQMINSSVVYYSTGTHYDPGVHLSLYRKPSSGNNFIAKDHGNGYTNSIN